MYIDFAHVQHKYNGGKYNSLLYYCQGCNIHISDKSLYISSINVEFVNGMEVFMYTPVTFKALSTSNYYGDYFLVTLHAHIVHVCAMGVQLSASSKASSVQCLCTMSVAPIHTLSSNWKCLGIHL